MCPPEELLKRISSNLVDRKIKSFKDMFFINQDCDGYCVDIAFNGEECFIDIYLLKGGIKDKKMEGDYFITKFLKSNNKKICEKFKYKKEER